MNNKIEVKTSPTHGKGVFALRNIKSGEIILKWDISNQIGTKNLTKLSPEERKYICSIDNVHINMQEPEKYINHSCNPNSSVQNFCDIAIRDISPGEEITGNYKEVSSDGPEIKCTCGSKNCIGKIFS